MSLGPDRIRANGYHEADIRREWKKLTYGEEVKIDEKMVLKIYNTFEVGKRYVRSKIKSTLKDIYSEFGYDKTAKASDLFNYFEMKLVSLWINKKTVHGFEILGKR